jgi:hypothetical protein
MDEILEAIDLIADLGAEGTIIWILRILGVLAMVVGIGLWVLTDMGFLLVPAILTGGGFALVVLPEVILTIIEVAG